MDKVVTSQRRHWVGILRARDRVGCHVGPIEELGR